MANENEKLKSTEDTSPSNKQQKSGISFSIDNILTFDKKPSKSEKDSGQSPENEIKTRSVSLTAALDLRKFAANKTESDSISGLCIKQINKNKGKYFNTSTPHHSHNHLSELSNSCITNTFSFGNRVRQFGGGNFPENGLADLNGYLHRHFLTNGTRLGSYNCLPGNHVFQDSKSDKIDEDETDNSDFQTITMDSDHETSFEAMDSDSDISVVTTDEIDVCDASAEDKSKTEKERATDNGQADKSEQSEVLSNKPVSLATNKGNFLKGMVVFFHCSSFRNKRYLKS